MADRCDLTELPAAMCAHCLGHTDPPKPSSRLGPWFTAAYGGRCVNCDDDYGPGDRIRADGEGGYLGDCCWEEHDG